MASPGLESLFSNAMARVSLVGYATDDDDDDELNDAATSFPIKNSLNPETGGRSSTLLAILTKQLKLAKNQKSAHRCASFFPLFLAELQTLKRACTKTLLPSVKQHSHLNFPYPTLHHIIYIPAF
jgi:hypothetical protein